MEKQICKSWIYFNIDIYWHYVWYYMDLCTENLNVKTKTDATFIV